MRHLCRFLALLCAFLLSVAHTTLAQTSFYGTIGYESYDLLANGINEAHHNAASLTAGAFYDFPIQSRFHVGLDGRGSVGLGANTGAYGLGAFRFSFVPHDLPYRPYAQIGGGVVSTDLKYAFVPNGNQRHTNGAVELAFGLDVRVNDSFDIRAIEWGAAAGGNGTLFQPSAATAFVNFGVVYHPHKHPKH